MVKVQVVVECERFRCSTQDTFEVALIPWDLHGYAPVERQIWMHLMARGWTMGTIAYSGERYPYPENIYCPRCSVERWQEQQDD